MIIEKTKKGKELTLTLSGRLDTSTAPQLEAEIKEIIGGVECLVLDLGALVYLSSSGLRVLLTAQKIMNRQGSLVIRHVSDFIAEVFEITGFSGILTIEQ